MEEAQVTVLVVGNPEDPWGDTFAAARPGLRVVVAEWDQLALCSYPGPPGRRLQVSIKGGSTCFVHAVLVRKLCRGLHALCDDNRNKLFAIMHSRVLCVNSAHSIYCTLDRPPCHAALQQIADRVGHEHFPLVAQTYFDSHRVARFTPEPPFVAKVGHAEAGYGKVLVNDLSGWGDFCGVLALHGDYLTVEPYHNKEYDMRIQKIGPHYRAYTRASSNWKTNVGSSVLTEVEVKPHWQRWADLASEVFGGLDILTVDAMTMADGTEIIIEINDTASGLAPNNKAQDMAHIASVFLSRLDADAQQGHKRLLHGIGKGFYGKPKE